VGVDKNENVLELRGCVGGGRAEVSVATLSERSEFLGRGDFNLQARRISSWDANTKNMTGPTIRLECQSMGKSSGVRRDHPQAATRMSGMTRVQLKMAIIERLYNAVSPILRLHEVRTYTNARKTNIPKLTTRKKRGTSVPICSRPNLRDSRYLR
jgi:hypothetical protein